MDNIKYDYALIRVIIWKGKREEKAFVVSDALGCDRDLTIEI
jgi:hypothetical protein